ncbi:MAG: DUF6412 domain-containing protein [Streptosporangiaceae bacterium]
MAWSMLNATLACLLQATSHVVLSPSNVSGVAVAALALCMLSCALTGYVLMAAWVGRIAAAAPLTSRVAGLREKSWRAAFLPQRDPDAAGRPRPRAPSAAQAAA